MRDLVIKGDWFPGFEKAPENIKKELFYRIIKYGCLEENILENENDDWILENNWQRIKGDLDRMKASQERSKVFGQTVGRKNNADPIMIWKYCQEHPSCKVDEIGKALDLPQTTASKGPYSYLYGNEGWKNRKDVKWLENFSSDFSNEFLEKIPKKESNLEEFSERKWNPAFNF